MSKFLSEMSVEELGKLFPIILSEPDPDWPKIYLDEETQIIRILGLEKIQRIEHIGSTAIPNLKAKPIIDILLEISESTDNDIIIEKLENIGYQFIRKPENPAPHMMFVKGYTLKGFQGQAFHVHVRYFGDWDEPCFRDYLRSNPAAAIEYEKLKLDLAQKYRNNRDIYTDKKSEFIKSVMQKARHQD